ncbi:MAG: integrase arm-type DNA-binding domain-containing protein [Erythrobacter sp.]|nr:integrase arm-type DNA-binding domain-containing protein [Erythrobacter sp.]MBO6530272.1 integrase arm-type DNA-binding domain-containing protein [Erythrobacter sp.]
MKRSKEAGKWILRLSISGKRREMGLGRWPDVSIAEARERAAEARRTLREGLDPIAEREKAKRKPYRLSVKEAIEGCFEARKAELKDDGEAGRWMSPLKTHVIPRIGKMPVEDVDQHTLKRVLDPIWHEKTEAAAKALQRMNLTLKHAAALGLDVDLQATMKARALLGKQRHSVTHIPSMPYQDAPKFYRWLTEQTGTAALALRFLILTLARTSEVRLATFDEIKANVWTLPRERTKTGKEHRIPLTGEALKIVVRCHELSSNEYLFPAYKGKPLSDMAMSSLMKREGFEARPHGFRATFRTWAEECSDAPFAVKESTLGHAVDVGVVGAYQRSDRISDRSSLLAAWTGHLLP